jgi:hypothetical protein|tara:strand:+ start:725 stop:883 length:159 start_codon:yes stop_codon:yes gene_type:complete
MAKMKIIKEVEKQYFENAKKSELKDNFEFKILEKKYYMIGGKRDWVILENIN